MPIVKGAAYFIGRMINGSDRPVPDSLSRIFGYVHTKETPWAENRIPLASSKVALVTTAGIFVKGQEPFREMSLQGDFAYRVIPRDLPTSRLALSKFWIDRRLLSMDTNIVLPIDRLKELQQEGVVKEVASNHYSFCGFCSDYGPLVWGSGKEVARRLRYEGVDKALVIAASVLSQESAVLVQRVIEEEGIPTVSLTYSADAVDALKPPRTCILPKRSLCNLDEYLDKSAQKKLVSTMLAQFDKSKRGERNVFHLG